MVPKISVIMPVYNADEFLSEAIESILNQTYENFEFLIICDDPSERTVSILNNFTRKDLRINVIYQKKQGLINSLNTGIRLAKGEYIARMDADDVSHPHRFEKQIEFLERNSDISLCGTWAKIIDKNGEKVDIFKPSSSPDQVKWDLHFFNPIIHPSVMIRKNFFEMNGQYLDSDVHCEDYALWVRAYNNTKLSNIPLILINLRKHDMNVSTVHSEIQMNHAIKVSQTALSSTLKYEIPLNNVKIIYRQSYNFSREEYFSTTKNLRQLQHSYLENPALSHEDRKYIKNSICMILYNIGILQACKNPILAFHIFVLSFMSEPISFIKHLGNLILNRRLLKKRTNSHKKI